MLFCATIYQYNKPLCRTKGMTKAKAKARAKAFNNMEGKIPTQEARTEKMEDVRYVPIVEKLL